MLGKKLPEHFCFSGSFFDVCLIGFTFSVTYNESVAKNGRNYRARFLK